MESKYPRKAVDIGPTVAGQDTYDWPDDFLLPIAVSLGSRDPLEATDPATAREYASGSLALLREGAWYEAPSESGSRQIILYPMPGEGQAINLEYVYAPPPMTSDSDEPTEIPRPFHEGLLPAAAATYYETVEDNPELAQRNSEQLDLWVGKLVRYDNQRRGGSDPFMVPIAGVSA